MQQRTAYLSKLIGIYCILAAAPLILRRETSVAAVMELVHSAPASFVLGMVIVAAGLALVLGHNTWSGGAAPVIVTLVGWATLSKGLLFLFLSPDEMTSLLLAAHYDQFSQVYGAASLVLGLYLTYAGYAPKAAR